MTRVAIVGSCITRDLWPFLGRDASELLYIARTSLPSLFAQGPRGIEPEAAPPTPLKRHPYNSLIADLKKTALAALVSFQPTHIIFDFIDERFDLLAVGEGLVTYSWELDASGYTALPTLNPNRRISRLTDGCDLLWRQGLSQLAAFLALGPLKGAEIILHRAQWAEQFRTGSGKVSDFPANLEIISGQVASLTSHNALLRRYEGAFQRQFPLAKSIAAPDQYVLADETHQWGLSPFHYVPAYYQSVCSQLKPIITTD